MDLTRWLAVSVESAREIAGSALGIAATNFREVPASELPGDLYGVYIPLSSEEARLQLGLLAERSVCGELARALIGLAPGETLDSDEDVLDAVGELANLVAGSVKVKVAAELSVSMGLPLALCGRVFTSSGSHSRSGILELDGNLVWLLVSGTSASTH